MKHFNIVNSYQLPKSEVGTYRYVSVKDVVDDNGRMSRKLEFSERKTDEPFTPQTGNDVHINDIGWLVKNHQKINIGDGEKSIVIHHGNPFLDCQPILELSKNMEILNERKSLREKSMKNDVKPTNNE